MKPLPKLFDADTGALDASVAELLRKDSESQRVHTCHQVELMAQSEGWKHIENQIFNWIEDAKEKLVDAGDINEILRMQQSVRAYSNVLGLVLATIKEGKDLRERGE